MPRDSRPVDPRPWAICWLIPASASLSSFAVTSRLATFATTASSPLEERKIPDAPPESTTPNNPMSDRLRMPTNMSRKILRERFFPARNFNIESYHLYDCSRPFEPRTDAEVEPRICVLVATRTGAQERPMRNRNCTEPRAGLTTRCWGDGGA